MERRSRSLEALSSLQYIDSLDSELKANSLLLWFNKYLKDRSIEEFDLELSDLKVLSELFYKHIRFLKKHQSLLNDELKNHKKIKEFLH